MSHTRVLTALLLGACVTAACQSPAAPSPQSPSVAGRWTGTYRVTSCNGGAQACFGLADVYRIQLELADGPAGVTGTIGGEAPLATITGALPASGVQTDSTLSLQASQPYLSQPYQPGVELRNWSTTINTSGTSMSGRFNLTVQFRINNAYPDMWQIEAELVSLTR